MERTGALTLADLQLRLGQLQQPATPNDTPDGDGGQLRKSISALFAELLPDGSFNVTESNKLSESILVESAWKSDASRIRLSTILTSLLPAEASNTLKESLPQKSDTTRDIVSALDKVSVSNLLLELNPDPLSLCRVDVGAQLGLDWVIVKGKDGKGLVEFNSLGLELSATVHSDEWEMSPYLTGAMTVAGGKLSGLVDLNAKSFFCVLGDDAEGQTKNEVNLKQLLTEALGLPEEIFPFKTFALTRFEIWGGITPGASYGIDIGTTFSWDLSQLGNQKVTIRDLFLKLEYDGSLTPALGGSLELFGMTFSCAAAYAEQGGWTFEVAAFNIRLTELLVSILGENCKTTGLPEVTFPVLDLTITPSTGAFRFRGSAEVRWEHPFGADADFACKVDLKLERQGTSNGAKKPVTCDIHFQGASRIKINSVELDATIDVKAKTSADAPLQLTVDGTLLVPMDGGEKLSFGLKFATDSNSQRITASWPAESRAGALDNTSLDFRKLASGFGADMSDVPAELIPTLKKLKFDYEFREKRLQLTAETTTTELVFLTAPTVDKKNTLYAFRLKASEISTPDMGALGSALQGYSIALDGLTIVAAKGTAPEELTLGGEPITEGLSLRGTLNFKGTSFSYPFECNLGGAKKKPPKLGDGVDAHTGAGAGAGGAGKPTQIEEANNNAKVGRKIGPITFRKVRFESRDAKDGKRVYVLIDASLGAGGFDLDLEGFNLNFPFAVLTDSSKFALIEVGLEGLSLSYSNPPLVIAGGFSMITAEEPYIKYLYQGHLLIKAEAFQIAVIGSYGIIKIKRDGIEGKDAALFLYGMYAGVIGGPPAFYVTGLALGGGYNTRLMLPPVEEVAQFPLVQAAAPGATLDKEKLRKIVQASYGDYWLALGIKFSSFKMADSFALFTVAFGNRLQFALLGVTTFTVPAGTPKDKSAMYAELAIRAVLDPDAGIFSFEGRLTQNSYLFSKEIRLVGGFAFFVWFGNSNNAGDFVISLGGYHPDFKPPSHYPVVPRIGIVGKIANVLTITGEAYLALTPSCLMAGLKLGAVFENDYVTAAFVAYADFLIAWAPFHYDARIGIGIAVVLRFLRSFKLEISADLHIWGPPFAGTARVTFWLASFSVEFGDQSSKKPDPLTWPAFRKAFLPPRPDIDEDHALLDTIRIREGMFREVKKGQVTYRVVNPHELMIETESVVPCSELKMGDKSSIDARKIGIRPMAARSLSSVHTVTLKRGENSVEEKFRPQWSTKNFPEALWSPKEASGEPDAEMIKDLPSGVVLRVWPTSPEHSLGPFAIEKFKYEPIDKAIPWALPHRPMPANIPSAVDVRNCLGTASPTNADRWNEINLSNTKKNWVELFQAPPKSAALA